MAKRIKKTYRKWYVEDIRRIQRLRREGVLWTEIAKTYKTSSPNVQKMFKYYSSEVLVREHDRISVVDAAMKSDNAQLIQLAGINPRLLEALLNKVFDDAYTRNCKTGIN